MIIDKETLDNSREELKPEKKAEQFESKTTFRNGRERNLEVYSVFLNFKPEEMAGKTILDIGSGEKELLARELAQLNIGAKIISLNPDYLNFPEFRKEIFQIYHGNHDFAGSVGSVGAIAQRLPFKNETFDEVFANHSLSIFVHPREFPEAADLWSLEIARVLKRGGKARISPLMNDFTAEYQNLFAKWDRLGLRRKIVAIKTIELLGEHEEWIDQE